MFLSGVHYFNHLYCSSGQRKRTSFANAWCVESHRWRWNEYLSKSFVLWDTNPNAFFSGCSARSWNIWDTRWESILFLYHVIMGNMLGPMPSMRAIDCINNTMQVIYRRYASLFFIVGVDEEENEIGILEFIHALVETLDRWFPKRQPSFVARVRGCVALMAWGDQHVVQVLDTRA